MNDKSIEDFEAYRRQRQRHRRLAAERAPAGPNNALRELEAVEAREHRDQQLQMEVNDFFESATRTAADIVQKVASSAKLQIDEQLSSEMHDFLIDSLTRMQDLVQSVLHSNSASTAEEVIEPLMHNLTGRVLDGFRAAGAVAENHLGQDPLETDLDEVRREFLARIPHEAAEMDDDEVEPDVGGKPLGQRHAEPVEEPEAAPDAVEVEDSPKPKFDMSSLTADQKRDLQRFKRALETLVRQGNMSKDEARAAWDARKAGLTAQTDG